MFKRSRKYSVLEKLNKMNTNEKFTWSKKQKVDFCFCYKNKRKSFYSIEKAFTNWEEFRSTEVRVNKDREKSEIKVVINQFEIATDVFEILFVSGHIKYSLV